ncbi:MAG TPA: hypothetical protein VLH37_04655 [Bacteroidales bacterium]|nr:hypothetical protein [Bacteroidales bacterium]
MDLAVLFTGLIIVAILVGPYFLVARDKKHKAFQNPPSTEKEIENPDRDLTRLPKKSTT